MVSSNNQFNIINHTPTKIFNSYLTEMNPKAPVLSGLIKLHKENKPIRPL